MASKAAYKPYLSTPKEDKRYTLEAYLRREARSVHKHEFIDGKIIKMAYAKGPHNIIAANMIGQLTNAFEQLHKNLIVFTSDQKIFFPTLNEGVYADALAVADKPEYWDAEELLLTNPLLVVEVLSRSTSRYDRSGKFDKYKTLESFKEYVLIRQDAYYAETWYREKPGLWHETIVTDLNAKLPLQSVGVSLSMERIYRNVVL